MKAFRFTLERVRELRQRQLEIEEAALERLFAERSALLKRQLSLDEERVQAQSTLANMKSAPAEELIALDSFIQFVHAEKKRIQKLIENCEIRIGAQRQKLIEARRKLELLDKLKDKQRGEWEAEYDREQENLASELYLAKWKA